MVGAWGFGVEVLRLDWYNSASVPPATQSCFWFWGLGFGVWGLGLRVDGLGFWVQGLELTRRLLQRDVQGVVLDEFKPFSGTKNTSWRIIIKISYESTIPFLVQITSWRIEGLSYEFNTQHLFRYQIDRLRVWEGYRESRRCSRDTRRCSRDTYPQSCITKYTSIRR